MIPPIHIFFWDEKESANRSLQTLLVETKSRTLDLTDANRALSQLSYAPKQISCDNVNYYIIILIVLQEGRKKKMKISVLFRDRMYPD